MREKIIEGIKKLYQEVFVEVDKENPPNPNSCANQKLALLQRVCDVLGIGENTMLDWEEEVGGDEN